ncbi:MAG TPA: ELWxxDGT repeat protein [Thermoanaerobaculia bacterium]|jgi:ELWxxDGT repeat protein
MKISLGAILLAFSFFSASGAPAAFSAGTAHLLVDANPGPPDLTQIFGYNPPTQFTELAGRAVFLVDSYDLAVGGYQPVTGPPVELWASDGTAGGTELLATFCVDGVESCHQPARLLGRAGGVAFLSIPELGFDSYHPQLWRTDGTREGTYRLLSELCPNDAPTGATETIAGGALYFAGFDAATGCQPWVSDGTPAGTRQAADLQNGDLVGSYPQSFAALGGRVYFTETFAGGLWSTDGTPGGTRLVRPVPDLELLTAAGGRLFFVVLTATTTDLWTSDGTAAGTVFVRSFPYSTCHDCDPVTSFLKPDGDGVLFLAGDGRHSPQVWRSDGTPEGTRLVAALPSGATLGVDGLEPAADLVDLGPALLFPVRRNVLVQLWSSRPPGARAARLTGCPEGCPSVTSRLQPVPGKALAVFAAEGFRGEELWASDGSAAGTRPVRKGCSGPCPSSPQGFVAVGGAVYFSTADAGGVALWRTDGTPAGTVQLGRASLPFIPGGIALGDRVLLSITVGARTSELWATLGTAATTERVKTFSRLPTPSSDPRFVPLGGQVIFTTQTGALWASDGSSARRLLDRPASALPPIAAGNLAFTFSGSNTDNGVLNATLLRTDGTPQGTQGIHDFGPDSFVLLPFAFGGRLVFFRCDTVTLPQSDLAACDLWASDGTAAGTVPFASLPPAELFNSPPLPPVVAGSHFYFFAVMPGETVLYRSDGTTAGTQPLGAFGGPPLEVTEVGGAVYIASGGGALERLAATGEPDFVFGQTVSGLQELNGRLLFFGASFDSPPRTGLWSTDGTEAGTQLLAPVLEQTLELDLGIYGPPQWTRLGSRLLFRGWDPVHGFELWATDGTPGGTVLVRDIAPGTGSSFPGFLTSVGNEVWFAANDGVHGDELWSSDGTPGGTRLRADLAPGPVSSSPQWLTLAGANLFFSADFALTGREPWVLPLQ